jgi:two-component system response regulator LytT
MSRASPAMTFPALLSPAVPPASDNESVLPAHAEETACLKLLVVEPDPAALAALERHCRTILGERLEKFSVVNSPGAATTPLSAVVYDAVLLDPQAWSRDEFDRFRSRCVLPTIIISASSELAVAAFEWGALDFVPKPISADRLAKALQRITQHRSPAPSATNLLAARRAGRIDFIPLDDLLYVEGDDKYSELVFANGRRNFHDKALGRLEETLPPSFVRIHKSYLVRFTMVSRILVLKGSRYFAELKNGQRLPVGRSRYESIKSRLLWPPPPNG